ncbi:MAG: zinc ribbon domain-containing protein [Planctomycetaceae bacterium]|jgi:hypothetical protein|nr:zinc ribbon domain-containing protein [Planctomycetaceae bacterium]
MSDVITIYCPSCGSKLNAKTALIGQTRNCPKCQTPVFIQEPPPILADTTVSGSLTPIQFNDPVMRPVADGPAVGEGTAVIENLPERLQFRNRYFVLGADRLVAVWEINKGWQVNTGNGFSPVKMCIQAIPDQGTFQFVELVISSPDDGVSLGGIPSELHIFKVSMRGALTALYRDAGEILHKVDGPGELTALQKNLLLNHLRQIYMYDTLAQAKEILAYLNG